MILRIISWEGSMEFYSLQLRRRVDVPDGLVRPRVVRRQTGSGEQVRYLLEAATEIDGAPVRVAKFVSREAFEAAGGKAE